jgi:hypothetical protein
MNYIKGICLANGDVILPAALSFASDENAIKNFYEYTPDDEKKAAIERVSAIDGFVDGVIKADIIKFTNLRNTR